MTPNLVQVQRVKGSGKLWSKVRLGHKVEGKYYLSRIELCSTSRALSGGSVGVLLQNRRIQGRVI